MTRSTTSATAPPSTPSRSPPSGPRPTSSRVAGRPRTGRRAHDPRLRRRRHRAARRRRRADFAAAARRRLASRAADLVRLEDGGPRHHPQPGCPPTTPSAAPSTTPACADEALAAGTTRSAAAVDRWLADLDGASPSSATRRPPCSACSSWCSTGEPGRPPIIGIPVGFVGAAESKQALADRSPRRALPHRPRPAGRQRHGGRRGQRPGQREGVTVPKKRRRGPAVRRGRRPGRPGADDAQGPAGHRRAARWSPTSRPAAAGQRWVRSSRHCVAAAPDRAAAGVPGHHRGRRPRRRTSAGSPSSTTARPTIVAAHLDAGARRRRRVRGRPLLLRQLHVPPPPSGRPLPDRGRPRRHLVLGGLRPRRARRSCR